jgi:hypothetical protein
MLAAAQLEEELEFHRFAFGLREDNSDEMQYVVGLRAFSFLEIAVYKGIAGKEKGILIPDREENCTAYQRRKESCEHHEHTISFGLSPQHYNMFQQAQASGSDGNLLRAATGMVIGQMSYSRTKGGGNWVSIDQVALMQEIVLRGNFLGNRTALIQPDIGEFFELEAAIAAEGLLDAG